MRKIILFRSNTITLIKNARNIKEIIKLFLVFFDIIDSDFPLFNAYFSC